MYQRLFAPPHSFSQLTTSFVISKSQGIPRVPLITSYALSLAVLLLTLLTAFFCVISLFLYSSHCTPICQATFSSPYGFSLTLRPTLRYIFLLLYIKTVELRGINLFEGRNFCTEVRRIVFFSLKEVFQPHLPVRLPCYDLAPVT